MRRASSKMKGKYIKRSTSCVRKEKPEHLTAKWLVPRTKVTTLNSVSCNTNSYILEQGKKFVEFFNPKIRRELEKKDEEFKKAYGYKGAAPGGDEWVWLTSYCRIPVIL